VGTRLAEAPTPASPFLVGVLAAAGVYYFVHNSVGLVLGGLLCVLGAILGARFANRARREGRLVALATGTRKSQCSGQGSPVLASIRAASPL